RRERRAGLGRDGREERVCRPVRSFRLRTGEGELREPTGLLLAQRERRQVGGQLRRDHREHAQVLLVVRGSPLDEQDADDSIQADERDSEAGPGAPRRRMLFGRETALVVIREKGEQAHGTGREDAPLLSRNVGDDDASLRATGSDPGGDAGPRSPAARPAGDATRNKARADPRDRRAQGPTSSEGACTYTRVAPGGRQPARARRRARYTGRARRSPPYRGCLRAHSRGERRAERS